MHTSLTDQFFSYFTPVYANTDALKAEVYSIRHDVYCDEFGFEAGNSNHVEKDAYDDYSHHFLVRHNNSDTYAGCIRLILPSANQPNTPLPIEEHFFDILDTQVIDPNTLVHGRFAELSRLAVHSNFRKRTSDRRRPEGLTDNPEEREHSKRAFPLINVGLYLSAFSLALYCHTYYGLDNIFMVTEPRLARNIKRFGLAFEQAGPLVEYHGARAPYVFKATNERNMSEETKNLLEGINDILIQQFSPHLP
ncbi:MAG: PEP-CTERM/exosortase system-associated acyltransferase [Pseudomonadales bacterium]|jgi:N-acyl amino acid synthase of PEP-CTERM/exosortase system|nr:PEP-CTERM/exosortase system-associated acyltransferase [Pseudomonadales bacterium]